jgi:hypothetical protein
MATKEAGDGGANDKLILPRSCVKRIMKLNGSLNASYYKIYLICLLFTEQNLFLYIHHLNTDDVKVVSAVSLHMNNYCVIHVILCTLYCSGIISGCGESNRVVHWCLG